MQLLDAVRQGDKARFKRRVCQEHQTSQFSVFSVPSAAKNNAMHITRYAILAKIAQFSTKTATIFAQISIFLKKFFIPFNISTYQKLTFKKLSVFRQNRASTSNYRGAIFSPQRKKEIRNKKHEILNKFKNTMLKFLKPVETAGSF